MPFIPFDDAPASAPSNGGFISFDTPPVAPQKPEGLMSAVGRGVKESFQQLPQLAYGAAAGVAAGAESLLGEGGIATAAKKYAVDGFQRWEEKIAAGSQANDSITTALDRAKEGDIGALADWLAHGIGYVGGQAVQVLATGGIGYAAGKATAHGAARALASGMVEKEIGRVAASEAGKEIVEKSGQAAAADIIAKIATGNVAGKLGSTAALGMNAFGMEGGEIFGELVSENRDTPLTGEQLSRAFGATVVAGGLEFLGDKLELSAMTGKGFGKGLPTRTGRAIAGGVAIAPAEAATEYGQTLVEEYGKGNEDTINPMDVSEKTRTMALDAAAMGALGGAVVGGAGGALAPSPKEKPGVLGAGSIDEAIDRFKFDVASATDSTVDETLKAAATFKDLTPEELVENQARLLRALERDSRFANDEEGNPTFNGAPLQAVAPQDLPAKSEAKVSPEGYEELSRDVYEALSTFASAQGKRLVVFKDDPNLPMEGFVTEAQDPETLFVSTRTKFGGAAVAGHEMDHLLAIDGGEKYQNYRTILQEELSTRAEEVARQRHGTEMGAEKLTGEISADITGDAMADPTFHGRILDRMREQLGEAKAEQEATTFLDKIVEVIERVKAVITGTTFTTPDGKRLATEYVKDLERVHDALAAAVADRFVRQGYRPPAPEQVNTGRILVERTLEIQAKKAEAEGTPPALRAAEQVMWAKASYPAIPKDASPYIKQALRAAQKPGFQRTPQEANNIRYVQMGVRMSPKVQGDTTSAAENNQQRAGWTVIDGGAGGLTREAAERWIRFQREGNNVIKPNSNWEGYDFRVTPDDTNPGSYLIEARKTPSPDITPSPKQKPAVVNIGLDIGERKNALTDAQVRVALKNAGVRVVSVRVVRSNTENTVVARLDRPLTKEEGDRVSADLQQDAIAQYADDKGELFGASADKWGPFNPEYFITADGTTLVEARRAEKLAAAVKRNARYLLPKEKLKLRSNTSRTFIEIINQLPSAEEMGSVALAGKAKRGWYRHSAEALVHIFSADAPRFAALLAATSPQNPVEVNLLNALNVWKNWVTAGRPQDRGEIVKIMGASVQGSRGEASVLDAWINNSVRALTSSDPGKLVISGPKVNSFMLNLQGVTDEVTNDAWMANYALVDQKIFAGSLTADGTDPGKGPGYLAMSAQTRKAAAYLTKLTGETWTPAEVQETVWSWAKATYELADSATETRSAQELVLDGEIHDNLINATPDFRTLLHAETYQRILEQAGYGKELGTLQVPQRGDEAAGDQGPRVEGEAGAVTPNTRHLVAAARRLDKLRAQRAAARNATLSPRPELDRNRDGDGARQANPQPDALSPYGVHFSKEPRAAVMGGYYGTGMKGAEGSRVGASADPRLKSRVYAYVNTGQGVFPEDMVGAVPHVVQLSNLYDLDANPLNLSGGENALESAILDAGYDGYFLRVERQAIAVQLGQAAQYIPAEVQNTGYRGQELQRLPAPNLSEDRQLAIDVANDKGLPAGQMTGADWKLVLEKVNPVMYGRLMQAGAIARIQDDAKYYRDGLARLVSRSDVTMSPKGKALLAPNGKPSKLEPRLHALVRTPAFKAWFGDWEAFAKVEGGVWNDGDRKVSKVVDNNGEPLVVYHGTQTGGFTEFSQDASRKERASFFTDDPRTARTYSGTLNEIDLSAVDEDGYAPEQRGLYPVFLNIRDPQESDFEGAHWDGSRAEQYVVTKDGDTVYTPEGRGYFDSRREAEELAEREGGEVEPAPDHYETTDSVVREAIAYGNDGAIIRDTTDPGPLGDADRANIYAVLSSNQVKSIYNSGAFDPGKADITMSPKQTQTAEFKKWFGDSKVVDENGNPLVVYHGTTEDFDEFKPYSHFGNAEAANNRIDRPSVARQPKHILPVYLSIQNPARLDDAAASDPARLMAAWDTPEGEKTLGKFPGYSTGKTTKQLLEERGFDGLVYSNDVEGGESWVAFRPEQIKSAIGNSGAFDPGNADITMSPKVSPSKLFGKEIAPLAIKAHAALDSQARRAVDGWNVNWHTGKWSPEVLDKLAAAFAPVRAKLREVYGDAIPLYRGEKNGESTDNRLFSWTPVHSIAVQFAINRSRGMPAPISTADIDRAVASFEKNGFVKFDGVTYKKSDAAPWVSNGYFLMYDRDRNVITDGSDLRKHLQGEKEERDAYRAKLEGSGKVYFAKVPVDSVVWIPSGDSKANLTQPELIADYNPRTQPASQVTMSPKWFSALEREITNGKTTVAPARGWKDYIKGLVNKGAVKQAEVEASGINEWLDLQQGKLTRSEITQYLEQNGVKVEEVVLGDVGPATAEMRQFEEKYGRDILQWPDEALARRDELSEQIYAEDAASPEAKFERYQLPGGENYRELLLTLPPKTASYTFKNGGGGWVMIVDGNGEAIRRMPNIDAAHAWVNSEGGRERLADKAGQFSSSHFDQPNLLAHVRFNERTDADGKRVLFVEEIQSDWAQTGKKRGFKSISAEERKARWDRYKALDAEAQAALPGIDFPNTVENEIVSMLRRQGQLDLAERYQAAVRATDSAPRDDGDIPSAPFVTKTDAWVGLALKRMIKYAADNGFDRVAWTTGAQQADRYDLSKQVGQIKADPSMGAGIGDNDWDFKVYDPKGYPVMQGVYDPTTEMLDGKPLGDVIGKDLAEKVHDKAIMGRVVDLRGLDLKVGGEGMITFYDKIVPGVAKDVLKKLGGGKIETTTITGDRSIVPDGYEDQVSPKQFWIDQPGFDITPELKERVAGGVPLFSPKIVGASTRQYTPEQLRMFRNVGRTVDVPSFRNRLDTLKKDLGKKMAQGLVDQFAPIKELSPMAYMLARLSKGAAGAFEALLHHGKLSINAGAFDADQTGGFIESVGVPLQGELEDFLWWVAANRAELLSAQDRERLFSTTDIAEGKGLASGTTTFDYTLRNGTTTRDRNLIFKDTLAKFEAFNRNVLDVAEQSGLIDPVSRKIWESEFYVPFYRVAEDEGGFLGAKMKNGLVRQRAFKRLKGSDEKINSDILANTLANWAHLIDASAKNRAAKASLEAAEAMGVAIEADARTVKSMARSMGKRDSTVWFLDQGAERHFMVDDPFVMTAITSLEYAGVKGPVMDALSTFKHWLTIGVTASPAFKIRNLIRDSVQAVAVSDLSYNIPANIRAGLAASDPKSQTYVSALASGGLIRFGTMLEGRASDRVRQLVKSGIKDTTILNSNSKMEAFYTRYIEPAVMAYNELGNRSEEINRAALYSQLRKQGVDHAEASLMARDLMDFSLQGSWTGIRFLTQVVPFMNARMQGMYKLGRGVAEDPRKFATVLGAAALFSVALMAAYGDDDDWKKREDWDRNNFWWFKMGGTAFRIPKPFEIGAMATLAERGLEYFVSDDMTGERLRNNVLKLLGDNLSMNPVPQMVKPIIDVYANKDSFTGRPLESMSMEKLRPDYRFDARTSMPARAISTAGQAVTSVVGADFTSPVKIDHMIRGYFGWLGSFVVGTADVIVRPMTNEPSRPTGDIWKTASLGFIQSLPTDQSRYVSHMYEQAREIEQAYGTFQSLVKQGRREEAKEFLDENRETLAKYKGVEQAKRAASTMNERIRMIERSALDPDVKQERIRAIREQQDKIARSLAKAA